MIPADFGCLRLETDLIKTLRIRFLTSTNIDFFVWDIEESVFFDSFFFEGFQIPDSRGYYFFDSETCPVAINYVSVATEFVHTDIDTLSVFSLWSFCDIEKSSLLTFQLLVSQQRKPRAWRAYFGCFHKFFQMIFYKLSILYFVSFTLVGVGYVCDFILPNTIRLIVSNTHDLLLFPPNGIFSGCRPALGESNENVSFFFCSLNYNALRNYVKTVRDSVFFNIYEYQGLLFSQEKKIKKITKRKQK